MEVGQASAALTGGGRLDIHWVALCPDEGAAPYRFGYRLDPGNLATRPSALRLSSAGSLLATVRISAAASGPTNGSVDAMIVSSRPNELRRLVCEGAVDVEVLDATDAVIAQGRLRALGAKC